MLRALTAVAAYSSIDTPSGVHKLEMSEILLSMERLCSQSISDTPNRFRHSQSDAVHQAELPGCYEITKLSLVLSGKSVVFAEHHFKNLEKEMSFIKTIFDIRKIEDWPATTESFYTISLKGYMSEKLSEIHRKDGDRSELCIRKISSSGEDEVPNLDRLVFSIAKCIIENPFIPLT